MNHDPRKAIRQALMVARRQAAYGGQQSYPGYRPINPLTGLPEDEGVQAVGSSDARPIGGGISDGGNDPGTPGPPGAPSTGDFGRDVAGFAEAAGPALGGMAIGGLMGGPAGAVMGGVASTMAQGLAEALGLSNPASAPPAGLASVAANVAETQMGMTPTGNPATAIGAAMTGPANPADQEDADQGKDQAAAQAAADAATSADNSNTMSEASTTDASADSDGGSNGDSGGAGGNGGGGGGDGFARGGDVKGGMDPRSLPGIHLKTNHRFADGGGVQPEDNPYMSGKDGKISFDSIPEFLNSRKIPFTVEHSKSMGNLGSSLSSYYKIETPQGKSTIRVSDHDYLPPSNGVDVRYGDLIEGAEARISDHLGISLSLPAQKAKQKQEEDRLNFLDQENENRLLNAPKPATIERQKQEQKAYWDRQREIEIRNAEIKKFKEEKKTAKLQRSADGGEIMPQRDLGADPAVQRAMDITRQVQPTAPLYKTGGAVGYADGGMPGDDPVTQQALRIATKKRPMFALADLFQRQLRGRPPS